MDVNGVQIIDIDEPVTIGMDTPIEIGEHLPIGTVSITENGTHNVGGYAKADVNVELDPPPLQPKAAMANRYNAKYVEPDEGYYGLSVVSIPPINLEHKENVYPTQNAQYIYPSEPEPKADLVMGSWEDLPYTTDMDLSSLENGSSYVLSVYIIGRRTTIREVFRWNSLTGAGVKIADNSYIYTFILAKNNKITIESSNETDNERFFIDIYKFNEYYVGLEGVEVEPIKLTNIDVYPATSSQIYGSPVINPIQYIISEDTTISEPYSVTIDASLMPIGMDCEIYGSGDPPSGGELGRGLEARFTVPETYGELIKTFTFDQDQQTVTIAFWTDSSHHTVTVSPGESAIYELFISEYVADGYRRVSVGAIKTTDLIVTPTKQSQTFIPDGSVISNIITETTVISTPYTVQIDATLMPANMDCYIYGSSASGGEIDDTIANKNRRFKVPRSTASAQDKTKTFRFLQTGRIVTINFWTDSTHHTITVDASEYEIFKLYIREYGNDGYDYVTVDPIPDDYIVPSGTKSITANGTGIDVSSYASVDVAVPSSATLTTKTITVNGTYNASSDNADGYSAVMVNVSGGGGGTVDSGVIFIDYDGTIVDSYSASEVASLTALPANPTHNGLTSQGWNWSLADIKTYFTNHPNEKLTVGQMYVTSDGKTRIEIELTEGRLSPYLSLAVDGNVSIDWGDGSTDVMTGSSLTVRLSQQHVYQSAGQYVITIEVTNGTAAFYSTSTYPLLNKNSGVANENRVYTNAVKKAYVGSNINIGTYAFMYCYSLTSITIPDGITSIGNSAFTSCYSLASITIPDGVTSIGSSTFSNCYSLASIAIPDLVTSIGSGAFNNCYPLASITIPDGVTSIGSSMFASCYCLTSITIPDGVTSIGNSAFASCYCLTSITIPDGVTSIGAYLFTACYSLTSITIPDGVTSIGNNAFSTCIGVAEYHFQSETPPTLGTTAFASIPSDCIIYVPSASVEAYKAAENWSTYASQIQGE